MTLTASPRASNGAASGPDAAPGAGSSQPEVLLYPRRRQSLGTRRQRIVAAVIIVGALGFLIERGLSNAINYYLTANQAVAQRAQLGDKDFRIQGTVLPGVHQVGTTLQFAITSHNVDVNVVSTGTPGQLFRVGLPVVLDGHWQGNVYSSFQIMVQHGSTYVEAHPTKSKSGAHSS
jgi:cytochrome c-type biogenesis protein CcmE